VDRREEGLLGSRAYVKEHFADRQGMQLKADHSKVSGYFNVDNGTGKIRGIYLQGNEAVRPIFESGWNLSNPWHDHAFHPRYRQHGPYRFR